MRTLAAAAQLSHPGGRSRGAARIPCGRLGMSGRHRASRLKESESGRGRDRGREREREKTKRPNSSAIGLPGARTEKKKM